MADRPRRIGLLAHCGNGNLGDEATLATIIEGIRRRDPTARVCAFTANPEDTATRHRIEAFPLRRPLLRQGGGLAGTGVAGGGHPVAASVRATIVARLRKMPVVYFPLRGLRGIVCSPARFLRELTFVLRAARHLRGLSMLVVAGGGQLGDYFGGVWGYPYYIFRWAILARAMGARVAFLSVGAGPIGSPVSRFMFRSALSLASYRSFRDQASRQLIEEIGVDRDNRVVPDVVLGLSDVNGHRARPMPGAKLTIAINPIPYFDSRYWAKADADTYNHHVRTITAFGTWLLEGGHRVVFFPTQLKADPPVIEDVRRIMAALPPDQRARLLDRPVQDFESLLAVISSADVVVTGRYHGQVLALVSRRPVIGLAYNEKTEELFRDFGLEPFAVDIATADLPALQARFKQLVHELDDIHALIDRRLGEHQHILELQFDLLFGRRPGQPSDTSPAP
jgi:polysaccharide pyruvyl transferase WcaK-like protein